MDGPAGEPTLTPGGSRRGGAQVRHVLVERTHGHPARLTVEKRPGPPGKPELRAVGRAEK